MQCIKLINRACLVYVKESLDKKIIKGFEIACKSSQPEQGANHLSERKENA